MDHLSLKAPVLLMARYNIWANEQFIVFFGSQDKELIEQHLPGSFPSIRKTLMHIWDAQHTWLKRLHGENPSAFLSATWEGDLAGIFNGLSKSSFELAELVKRLSSEELYETIRYTTFSSGAQESRRYEILLHVFNHSMYHRGQCVTMARTLEMTGLPSTDLIRYLRLQGMTT